MILMSTAEVSAAIGAKCGGSAPAEDDPDLARELKFITTRVEAALNVASLTRGYYRDRLSLPPMPTNKPLYGVDPEIRLRLTNGFLAEGTATLLDPDGEEVDLLTYGDVDHLKGIIRLSEWRKGVYFAEYSAGFVPAAMPDPVPDGFDADARVLQNVPEFIRAIVAHYLVMWYRVTQVNVKASKDISYMAVLNNLRREIYAWVYGKYQRPRAGCVFGESRGY